MFSRSVELYDLIYSTLKDYAAEARTFARVIRSANPNARTVLDAGCGTGEHARALAGEGFEVDGIDLEPGFLEIARTKHPAGRFEQADMAEFHLGRRYDAVVSLFSAIGYVRTPERLRSTLRCFREHLNPGGVVVVEPWFQPEQWIPGYVSQQYVEADGKSVVRLGHASREGNLSVLDFHYLIATRAGIEHRQERHELGLFTQEEMLAAFDAAGLAASFENTGATGRGLYVAAAR